MKPVLLLAHEVITPLEQHRRMEFSERVLFLSKHFKNLVIVSTNANIKANEVKLEFERKLGIYIYRIPTQKLAATLQFTRLIKNIEPSLVICDSTSDAPIVILSKVLYNYPLAVFAIAFDTDLFILSPRLQIFRNSRLGLLIKGLYHLVDSFIFNLSDKIISVSLALNNYISQFISQEQLNKVKLIPNSYEYLKIIPQDSILKIQVKLNTILKQFEKDQYILSYAGNLTFNKRPDLALLSFYYLLKKIDNIILFIIGAGYMEKDLRYYCKKLHLEKRVFFTGTLDQYDAIALVSKSAVLINPSLSEGFSNIISEAMAVGTPVVSFAHKSISVLCKEKGVILVHKEDPKAFAAIINNLLKDYSYKEKTIRDSIELITPLVNYTTIKRFSDILEELINTKHTFYPKYSITIIFKIALKWIRFLLQSNFKYKVNYLKD